MPDILASSGIPARNALNIDTAKSDSVDLAPAVDFVFCGLGGTVKFTTVGGQTLTVTMPDGGFLWFQIKRVWSTGTTATELVGGY